MLLSEGNLSGAMNMLSELCSYDNQKWDGVGPPKRGLPRLAKAVDQSKDETIKDSFKVYIFTLSLSPVLCLASIKEK